MNTGKFVDNYYEKYVTFSKAVLWKTKQLSLPVYILDEIISRNCDKLIFIDEKKKERWTFSLGDVKKTMEVKTVGQEEQYYFSIDSAIKGENMIKNARAKGYRLEADTVKFMKKLLVNFKRVGMSGQLEGLKGDFMWIESGKSLRGEAKSGNHVPDYMWKTLEKDKSDFLVLKRDRKERLWVLTDKTLKQILKP